MNFFVRIHLLPLITFCAITATLNGATYEVTFDATWSATTHPGNYPSDAHFSPLIGATHNSDVALWSSGDISSDGIEQMAETGATSILSSEISSARTAGTVMNTIRGPRIDSPDSTSLTFEIEPSHSLVSLVTMIAPSPDWFIGIDGLDLFQGGVWADSVTVDLSAYDAGTDSGTGFTSGNSNTNPAEPIELLGAPLAGTPPMGTFTFDLVSVPEPSTGTMGVALLCLSLVVARRSSLRLR